MEPPSPTQMPTTAAPVTGAVAADAVDTHYIADAERWLALVADIDLRGPARELAAHALFVAHDASGLRLSLPAADEHLRMPALMTQLADALASSLGSAPKIRFETVATAGETLHQRDARQRDARQIAAESAFAADPDVQRLISRHGASIVADSIRPHDEA